MAFEHYRERLQRRREGVDLVVNTARAVAYLVPALDILTSWCIIPSMKRTNIYLEDDQLRLLKHIAVEEGRSFTELVRRALREFLERYQQETEPMSPTDQWNRRLEQLLARVRPRTNASSPEEIEADISAAWKEARRRRSHATRSR
ncbi:ribbon-helix-helix domain-containing protein [Acidobacteria bacterium AH-259-G07]|nr:ribbon-helix-helix domain-containing protein [Acidobacteria bacterium AH-259-G07]